MSPPRELGFGDGLRSLFGGVRWLIGSPSAWPLAAVPCFVGLVLVIATSWGVFALGSHFFDPYLGGGGAASSFVRFLAGLLWLIVSVVLGLVVGLSLAQAASAPALDALAKKRARELGVVTFVDTPPLAAAWRSLRVVTLALCVGLPVIGALSIVTMLFPVAAVVTLPLKFMVAAWLATWDVFDYAFGLEGLGVRARLQFLARHGAAAFAFGLAFAAVALVPGLGLLVLPMGVAGSTDLWVKSRGTPTGKQLERGTSAV